MRFFALWYFTILLIAWTILGDTVLGFEQSYAQPIVGVLTACAVAFFLEWLDARMNQRMPRFAGSTANVVNFLPPCIIPGLACAMLIYANARLAPIVFAAALSLASKVLFRAPIGNGQTQHIFNPSNFGITMTLLLLPAAGLAPPYQFTENVTGSGALADSSGDPGYGNHHSRKIYGKAASGPGLVLRLCGAGADSKICFLACRWQFHSFP